MNELPQEIIDNFIGYLDAIDLKHVLTVSRKWQYSAERSSRAFEKFTLSEENVDKFLRIYSGRRFYLLKRLRFKPTLPALDQGPENDDDDTSRSCRESAKDLEDADKHFTDQMNFLFRTLKKLERAIGHVDDAHIRLTIYTPTRLVLDEALYCKHLAFVSWRLKLLHSDSFPSLDSIKSLVFKNGSSYKYVPFIDQGRYSLRKMDLRAMVDITKHLVNLQSLKCRIGGDEEISHIQFYSEGARHYFHAYEGPLRDTRQEFARAIQSTTLPDNLREVDLDFTWSFAADRMDQRHQMPNLVYPNPHDTFSTSLRILSYSLRRLNIRAILDKTIFWPDDENAANPTWPNLEVINICFHLMTPSGEWYFRGLEPDNNTKGFKINHTHYPPFENTEEDDRIDEDFDYIDLHTEEQARFRVFPHEEILIPFLSAFALAARMMPKLEEAGIWAPLSLSLHDMGGVYESLDPKTVANWPDHELAWGIIYARPGTKAHFFAPPGENMSSVRQFWWKTGEWMPDAALHDAFREIGRDRYGDAFLEHYGDGYEVEGYGRGLVRRSEFEVFQDWFFYT